LIAAEARKRGKSSDEIIEAEINSRITPQPSRRSKPLTTPIAIKFGNADLEIHPGTVDQLIRNERIRNCMRP